MTVRSTPPVSAQSISVKSIVIKGYVPVKDKPDQLIERDIRNIVVNFSIMESIYSPTLELELSVQDSINLMEYMNFSGQETIAITLAKGEPDSENEIIFPTLNFIVTDYPVYGKSDKNNMQAYTINAISTHAFLSGTQMISRAYKDGINTEILSLLNIIGIESLTVRGTNQSKSRGIFPYMSPLAACEFLRKFSYDENNSPFYLFQTIDGSMNFISHSYMIGSSNKLYASYYESAAFQGDVNSEDSYNESQTHIINLVSELNMSKYDQMRNGAYASSLWVIDTSDKTISKKSYSYIDANHLNDHSILSSEFKPNSKQSLTELGNSAVFFINKNKNLFTNNFGIGHDIAAASQYAISYNELFDNITHEITVAGDFTLHAGSKVNLNIQKAIDPELRQRYNPTDKDDSVWNNILSGDYIVTTNVHSFMDDEYFCHIQVKKDI